MEYQFTADTKALIGGALTLIRSHISNSTHGQAHKPWQIREAIREAYYRLSADSFGNPRTSWELYTDDRSEEQHAKFYRLIEQARTEVCGTNLLEATDLLMKHFDEITSEDEGYGHYFRSYSRAFGEALQGLGLFSDELQSSYNDKNPLDIDVDRFMEWLDEVRPPTALASIEYGIENKAKEVAKTFKRGTYLQRIDHPEGATAYAFKPAVFDNHAELFRHSDYTSIIHDLDLLRVVKDDCGTYVSWETEAFNGEEWKTISSYDETLRECVQELYRNLARSEEGAAKEAVTNAERGLPLNSGRYASRYSLENLNKIIVAREVELPEAKLYCVVNRPTCDGSRVKSEMFEVGSEKAVLYADDIVVTNVAYDKAETIKEQLDSVNFILCQQ
ncbi:MAG: hypothetical protein P8J32_06290, partial [bacterium]|nr:hypothetical protein [bacterium]